MIKVEILNPDVLTNLYSNHGKFACVCYDTPEKYAEKVGESCEASGHMSGSRCEYIKFRITGLDRGTAEQCLRHEIGVHIPFEEQDNYSFADYSELVKDVSPDQIVKNMASFRYIDKTGFSWSIPTNIGHCEPARGLYDELMYLINTYRIGIIEALEVNGIDHRQAVEDANFVLPRATETSFVIGFTPEALIHFCHKRMCVRAQHFVRKLALEMKKAVAEYCPKLAAEMVPHCQHLLWCPEGSHSCHAAPTKDELRALMKGGDAS